MILSTLARCLQTVELNGNGNSEWNVNDYSMQMRRDYARELAATSQIVERYVNVPLHVDTFDEYMTGMGRAILFPQHILVRSINSFFYDPLGLFGNSGYTTLTEGNDFTLDPDQLRIHLVVPYPAIYPPPVKEYKINLTAGYAYDPISTVYKIANVVGSPVVGTYDQPNGERIKITALDLAANVITFEPDIGNFDVDDVVACGTGNSITLGDCIQESIANNYASLEAEVIRQVNYAYERRRSAGKHSTTSGNSQTTYMGEYQVLQTLKDACDNFQYYGVGC